MKFLIYSALIVAVLSAAHGRKGGKNGKAAGKDKPHGFLPPFLRGANQTVIKDYQSIPFDNSTTIASHKQNVLQWAAKWDLQNTVQEFFTNMTNFKTAVAKNVSDIITNLPAVSAALQNIFNNEDQTRSDIKNAVAALKTQYGSAVDVVFSIPSISGHHHEGRENGRKGGRFGGMSHDSFGAEGFSGFHRGDVQGAQGGSAISHMAQGAQGVNGMTFYRG